jgi:hypothetical protein
MSQDQLHLKLAKPEVVVNKTQTAEEKRKQKMQESFKKLVTQIKNGCQKEICFSKYCKNNKLNGKCPSVILNCFCYNCYDLLDGKVLKFEND